MAEGTRVANIPRMNGGGSGEARKCHFLHSEHPNLL
jgi:hypothetical protein